MKLRLLALLAGPALLASVSAHGQAKPIYNDQSITVLQGLAFGPLRSEAIPVDDAHGLPVRCMSGCSASGGDGTPTGVAGTPNAKVVTIQGIPGAAAIPVSGTLNPVTLAATSTAIAGTSSVAQVVGPFVPQLGRAITVALSAAAWPGGTAQLLRSTDGGTTRLPLMPAGVVLGTYTRQGVDQPWLETEAGATFYLSLPNAGIGYRVSQ
ncbi:hypothetical protein [Sphingomonas albertensis]|uniref:Uncharacterized protein n=1 Tax=Sphingomonas albertensis TaxID=2762591 RepID=A0ABR7AKF5_9SPHN|nr:hypothetical protein [Sphingomonas albertensis]MBC3940951.1 hypothetical protein [Sphingomonas albertensis]